MSDQTKFTSKLHGKRILIIGGTSGMGYALAEAALEQGATDVILASSNPAKVDQALAALKAAYPRATASATVRGTAVNLADMATVDASIRALLDFATRNKTALLDHLVFTAGDKIHAPPLAETTAADVAKTGMIRFVAQYLAAKDAGANGYIAPSPDSSISMTGGDAHAHPIKGWSLIAGYAAGLAGFARALAGELAPVRVNVVTPGAVDTGFWDVVGMPREESRQGLKAVLPVGRPGRPEDIAETFLYLMRNGFITGQEISTNGGAGLKQT